jgi:cytochrome P450
MLKSKWLTGSFFCSVAEYLIPSGWKVLPVFSAVHLNPSLHGNAQQFQPCRWEVRSFFVLIFLVLAIWSGNEPVIRI